jgi:hypothetical protein
MSSRRVNGRDELPLVVNGRDELPLIRRSGQLPDRSKLSWRMSDIADRRMSGSSSLPFAGAHPYRYLLTPLLELHELLPFATLRRAETYGHISQRIH